jgi:hypothetical protein
MILSGFHASIRSLNALPEALVFQIVYDCLDALFDKAAAPRADSYLEVSLPCFLFITFFSNSKIHFSPFLHSCWSMRPSLPPNYKVPSMQSLISSGFLFCFFIFQFSLPLVAIVFLIGFLCRQICSAAKSSQHRRWLGV